MIRGIIANASAPRMFHAGVLRGLLITATLVVACNPHACWTRLPRVTRRAALSEFAAGSAKPALPAPVIILGGIYGGVFTPTEAGVVGVVVLVACLPGLSLALPRLTPDRAGGRAARPTPAAALPSGPARHPSPPPPGIPDVRRRRRPGARVRPC